MSPIKKKVPSMKQTCEACYASKVKCSKEHPVCRRCARTNRKCVYKLRKARTPKTADETTDLVVSDVSVIRKYLAEMNVLPKLRTGNVLQR